MRNSRNPQRLLQQLAEEHGSQLAAAKILGIRPSYYSDLLHGRRHISDRILDKLGLCRIIVRQKDGNA